MWVRVRVCVDTPRSFGSLGGLSQECAVSPSLLPTMAVPDSGAQCGFPGSYRWPGTSKKDVEPYLGVEASL